MKRYDVQLNTTDSSRIPSGVEEVEDDDGEYVRYEDVELANKGFKEHIEELEAELARYQWRSIKDELPSEDEEYFVWMDQNQRGRDWWYENNWECADICPEKITHWMPIPPLPGER